MKRFPNRLTLILALALFGAAAVIALAVELKTSRLQAHFLGTISQRLSFEVLPGASDAIYFPQFGPYDQRLGYTKIPAVSKALAEAGFKIAHQARQSQAMLKLRDFGLYPIYKEKTRAGLEIRDRLGDPIYSVLRPERYYTGFEEVPKVILSSILFIENREALDERYAFSNPAVEWDRFLRAIMENAYEKINPKHQAPGGSTIATQLEKYRHSRGGRTRSAKDKLVQMAAAGLRAYQGGEDTIQYRKGIVLTYINSIPLAALPGYGEVNGLGDGLWAWYGRELREVNSLLSRDLKSQAAAPELFEGQARAFKQVLSLFVAHRRPTYYLLKGNQALEVLTNEYLDRLRKAGIIGDEFCRLTKKQELNTRKAAPEAAPISFVLRKAANAIRTKLLSITKIPQLYDLDQLDLVVESTIDKTIHDAVTSTLDSLRTRKEAEKLGLLGGRTLGRGDPAKVIYSFTLYEHVDGANLLRVQTDNLDRPFDINEGTRLDLGSTAKLRTLVTYLEVIEEIFSALQPIDKNDRSNSLGIKPDPLTIWVAGYLKENPDAQLKEVLEASMQRRYSASPAERFFTGGGLHTFENFKREDDVKNPSVREAIRDSINLPFVRLMRDVSRYYRAKVSGEGIRTSSTTGSAAEAGRKKRQEYIARFADKEGSEFVREFYARYSGGSSSEILQLFLSRFHLTSNKAAIIFRHIFPNKDQGELADFIKRHAVSSNLNERSLERLFERYHPEKLSLNDKGYLLRIHPLELWLVGHLYHAPDATCEEVLEAGQEERQEAYQWLFNPSQERAQDLRINILMEADAFEEIKKSWRRTGYPFGNIVPSYASAIGSSGDRPAALAELIGIILLDGIRYPEVRLNRLHFAATTPYETDLIRNIESGGERVLSSEVAAVAKRALLDVVQNGTARRVAGSFKDAGGNEMAIGGKTGTGDHRFKKFGRGGVLLSSRVVSRTATFAFFIGERFFGVVSAHVKGPEAAQYDFTSALAAGLLKALAPALMPIVASQDSRGGAY